MFVQVQLVLDKDNVYKLVARIHTDNDTPLVHQQVIELDTVETKALIKALHPNMVEFEGVTVTASPETIEKALAEQAALAEKTRAEKEAQEAALDILADKEIVVEA